jgi:glycosyltransferase involved in cell wall biosynthesis
VQEDGDNPVLADVLGDDARYHRNGTRLGIAATRNLALSRATGDLVQNLDHDDVLLPHALATVIARFEQHPIHWAIASADDLLVDGTRKPYPPDMPHGLIPPGEVNRWAERHGGNWPLHGGGLAARTETLRAIGGWTGIPLDDDLAALAALFEVTLGWHDHGVTWLYRIHAEQTSRRSPYPGLEDTGRRIALQRVKALQNTGLDFTVDVPAPGSHVVDLGRNIRLPLDGQSSSG